MPFTITFAFTTGLTGFPVLFPPCTRLFALPRTLSKRSSSKATLIRSEMIRGCSVIGVPLGGTLLSPRLPWVLPGLSAAREELRLDRDGG